EVYLLAAAYKNGGGLPGRYNSVAFRMCRRSRRVGFSMTCESETVVLGDSLMILRSATSFSPQTTTDIKPTNNTVPTIAAGTPPDLPVDADAVDAGMIAGVPGVRLA